MRKAIYDVAIVGGGLLGATLADLLSRQKLRVALIEQTPFTTEKPFDNDARSLALSYGTRSVLERWGLWTDLVSHTAAIKHIHISERGRLAQVRLDHAQERVPALGYVIENGSLGQVLWKRISAQTAQCDVYCPAQLVSFSVENDLVALCLRGADGDQNDKEINARLVVAADGVHSRVRSDLGIPIQQRAYGQSAVVVNIGVDQPSAAVAYEYFTATGPLAALPLPPHTAQDHGRFAIVWTLKESDAQGIADLSDQEFIAALQAALGFKAGRIVQTGKRAVFPLHLVYATEATGQRIALIGNAMHTLHPVAGQGFNLGIRDVMILADLLKIAQRQGDDYGATYLLHQFAERRKQDQQQVIRITDALARGFTSQFLPVVCLRQLGLLAIDSLPGLKSRLARQMMGLNTPLPCMSDV